MGNIPNTTTNGLVLTSVGNGSNDSQWATSSGGGSGITQLTGDVTAGPGSGSQAATVAKINGSPLGTTTGAPNGYVLTWNSTSGTWVPAASSAAPTGAAGGNLSGTYPNPTVAKINGTALGTLTSAINGNALIWSTPLNSWIAADPTFGGYTVNMGTLAPTTDNGSIPYFSNVGAVNQFVPGPVPTTTGHYYSWNTGASGHWEVLLANPGGALSNQGWPSSSIIPASGVIPTTASGAGKMVEVTGVIGFSSYLIGFNITAKNNDATTGRNLNAFIYQSGSSVAQSQQFMVNNQIGSTSVSYMATGLSSSTTYSFAGYASVGGATTGTANFATITVLGIA